MFFWFDIWARIKKIWLWKWVKADYSRSLRADHQLRYSGKWHVLFMAPSIITWMLYDSNNILQDKKSLFRRLASLNHGFSYSWSYGPVWSKKSFPFKWLEEGIILLLWGQTNRCDPREIWVRRKSKVLGLEYGSKQYQRLFAEEFSIQEGRLHQKFRPYFRAEWD